MKKLKRITLAVTVACISACSQSSISPETTDANNEGQPLWPKIDSAIKKDPKIEQKVQAVLKNMTLEQKIAQMIQPEIRDISVEDMRKYGFGSYLNGGGSFPNANKHSTTQDWIELAEQMYQASVDDSMDGSTIPTMWGTDAVHGHNNVIGATLFPHNIGLGAANNPALIEKIAKATAQEVMATGIDWVFAPTVATVRDDRWGRTYEGYSEDPEIVKQYAESIVKGLQGSEKTGFLGDEQVISTVKHFVGDGGTIDGVDQGNNTTSEADLFNIHAQGYMGGLTAGAQSVMASFNSWNGEKIHGSHYLLTQVLKNKMGFDGFVVGDWNGHGQIKGCTNENCPQAANAGLDIYMAPGNWKALYENTLAQAQSGVIPESRINDAVTRILRVKFRAGLFDKPSPAKRVLANKPELIGHPEHRKVAEQAVRESLVLLKNNQQLLPLNPNINVLVAGDAADNIGKQSGGWTITWQGTGNQNSDFPGGSSIYDGIAEQVKAAGGSVELNENANFTKKPDVAIVVFGEEPYAEGVGDRAHLGYQLDSKTDLALLKRLKAQNIPVVSIFISGRPMWVNAELNASDAFVAAWLPGSEGSAVADVLFTDSSTQVQHDFVGKLSFSWPNSATQQVNRFDKNKTALFDYGYGLTYQTRSNNTALVSGQLNEVSTLASNKTNQLNLFDGKVGNVWEIRLFNQSTEKTINSNSEQLNGVYYRTIDRFIQEDAFRVRFDVSNKAGIKFELVGDLPDFFSTLAKQQANLVLDLKRESEVNAPVFISMSCEKDLTCKSSVDISKGLNKLGLNEWQTLSVSPNCFEAAIMSDSQLTVPFELNSLAELNLSISQIELSAKKSEKNHISCN
ncbi:glycoside hydrolase family 3 protein [Catenovulum adriaticum]|uniref:Exo 1,3/1,4-beta-D-glucan glucohydrolase n=1 Tax=Catenovulum adriaticum TaxID=2984846 RepID=A0ABY7AR41_9ALTE|nr:glycoside hydrolase family 3 protein [Catenovulum sp. TS8]WAJ70804.1 exo 1,3/1,4-beta-D-glucan glucohydrolase [Catenovulum sp. TS8]